MLALYLLAVGLASGLVGLFVHGVLAEHGYAAGYQASLWMVGGGAAAYAALQFVYYAVIMAIKPARGGALPLAEAVSQCAALVFLPRMLDVSIAWPDPLLERIEPLIFLGAFAVLHGFSKLFSFFSALQSPRGLRFWALPWLGVAAAAGLSALTLFHLWIVELDAARPEAPEDTQIYRTDMAYAEARLIAEGAVIDMELSDAPGRSITLRWAAPDDLPASDRPSRVHVAITLRGASRRTEYRSVRLRDDGWAVMRIPSDALPEGTDRVSIMWTAEREPAWRRVTGFRPVFLTDRQLLLSGPVEHYEDATPEQPNIVLLAIEGLGSEHMSRLGYEWATTPALDRFAGSSYRFFNAFTTAPEAAAGCMSILTGLYPLQHGYLGRHGGPLPEGVVSLPELLRARGYATAAFTEGQNGNDLVFGSGFERGFEIFDEGYAGGIDAPGVLVEEPEDDENAEEPPPSAAARSRATLENARRWIDGHQDVRFMTFIRISELGDMELRERYGAPFAPASGEPSPRDVFDTTLAYLDRHVGAFLQHLRDQETRRNTIIVVTSPYGFDFSPGATETPTVGIREMSLRTPVLIFAQWLGGSQRDDLIGLEDIAPSLLSIMDARFPHRADGQSFLTGPNGNEPLSVYGDRLIMTKRSSRWRLIWDTGVEPFTLRPIIEPGTPQLYDVRRIQGGQWGANVATQHPDLVTRWTEEMRNQLDRHRQRWIP